MRNVALVTKANVPSNKRLHFQPKSCTVPCLCKKNQKSKLCEVHLINTYEVPHLLLGTVYPNVKNVTRYEKPLFNRLKSHKASFPSALPRKWNGMKIINHKISFIKANELTQVFKRQQKFIFSPKLFISTLVSFLDSCMHFFLTTETFLIPYCCQFLFV